MSLLQSWVYMQDPDELASDDEERWAREQIRKGTAGSADPTAVAAARTAVAASAPQEGYARGPMGSLGITPAAAAGAVWLAQPDQLTLAGQDVVRTLQQGVAQLQVSPSLPRAVLCILVSSVNICTLV